MYKSCIKGGCTLSGHLILKMEQSLIRERSALVVDSRERLQRVKKYLEELKALDLTKVEEEQQMVKRRSCLMK